uniref:Uncharacterized protein n=1 Tax=Rhizophora mucronata TaxID=61149 RepID=A0A2P2M6F6_RHIMU
MGSSLLERKKKGWMLQLKGGIACDG